MATGQAKTADEVAEGIRAMVDRLVDAEFTKGVRRRGREVAVQLAQRGAEVGEMASDAWRDAEPARRDARKRMERASRDAARWSEKTWRSELRPRIKQLWGRRGAAIGAAAAAVPVGREVVEGTAQRMGLARREERHWGAFFLGLVLGAIAGAVVALLTAPKPGREMRHDLGVRAEGMRDEIAARARDREWMPLFQREGEESGNGGVAGVSGAVQEGAAEAGTGAGGAAPTPTSEPPPATTEPTEGAADQPPVDVEREGL
jgi:gas vesicle protein